MFALESSDASNYLDMDSEDVVVTNLLDKYKITTAASFLYDLNDDYVALTNYISKLYFDYKEIPSDIQNELENNIHYRTQLLAILKQKMNNILSDNTTIIFKEIVTIVNLLSFGKDYKIFESYNFYNLENLATLFRDYEKKLIDLKTQNEENFLITFGHYVTLIEVINELCTINSTDVLRKKTINPIIETLSETINISKFKIELSEQQINVLNNILGKLLFFYSHVPYINTKGKNAQYLIDEFAFNFEKLCDGYSLSKNTGFAGDQNTEQYYKIFLNSATTLISTLIYKLENTYTSEDYDISRLHVITELYDEMIEHIETPPFQTILELKNHLLNNYVFIYEKKSDMSNYLNIIDEFIKKEEFNSSNMHIIKSLVLYSSEIDEKRAINILKILLTINKYKNDYHEFYKLNLCDVIIKKLTLCNNPIIKDELNESIVSYIERNKVASHLMSIYSKIYLSLSLYYSYYFDNDSNESSKYYYYKFKSINGKDLLNHEYLGVKNSILQNLGKKYIDDIELEDIKISKEKYISLGRKIIEKYSKRFEINLKYGINQRLTSIVNDIFTNEGLNNDLLNQNIDDLISKNIFHGLVFATINGLCERNCRLIDIGYEKLEIPLIDGYTLIMAYSVVYKHIFTDIFEYNKDYIKQNIINLLISYLKSVPLHYDTITKLANIEKLQADLNAKNEDEDELIFIEMYIKSLKPLNAKYSYSETNKFFRNYAQEINDIAATYKLSGPRVGIVLKKEVDYKEIIKKIEKITIKSNKETFESNLTFAISWGNKNNILMKSDNAMTLALKNNEKYHEFK